MVKDTEKLLERIKELCEVEFEPEGYYYVDKLTRNGQTSLVLHILFDSPEEEDHYPEAIE